MTEVRFIVPGRVAGKGRPRATSVGGFTRLYTPAKTRSEEAGVAMIAKAAMRGMKPLEGPLWLDIVIVQRPPASWSKKKAAAANWIIQKPDFSNQQKLLEDAINGIVFVDDSQIAKVSAERVWRMCGDERVEVKISTLE